MSPHPYELLSLLPPVAAIALAIATRKIVSSLLIGILAGAAVMAAAHHDVYSPGLPAAVGVPLAAVASTFRDHLWPTLVEEDKLAVFAFTLLMGALVGIIQRSGGMRGLVDAVSRWASNARRGQLAAWALGLVVFIDDYANTMLLGGTLRPLFDRLRISREKLAYVVDSTAAPVSGLALVSTWVAGEIQYVRDGIEQLPAVDWDPVRIFLDSIPYRFYVLWALLLVPLSAWMRRDLGSMAEAERRAAAGAAAGPDGGEDDGGEPPADDAAAPSSHWLNAVVPILTAVGAIVCLMARSGAAALAGQGVTAAQRTWMDVFGNADAFMSLVWGSLIGVAAAAALARVQGLLDGPGLRRAAAAGAANMLPALVILWLASTMSAMTGGGAPRNELPPGPDTADVRQFPHQTMRLYTGQYLGGLLESRVPPALLPTLVFLLAGAVAFATGTSWGTMGVIMPLTIGAAYQILLAAEGEPPRPDHPILVCSVGSVLAGAIFGDHCSPISDTTVMSSQACGCSHIDHVRTQMPYALLAGGVSILLGTLPVGLGASPWLLLPAGVAAMAAFLWLAGSRAEGG